MPDKTPEQLVKELREQAVYQAGCGNKPEADVLRQAANLIESQGKQLNVAAKEWDFYFNYRTCEYCPIKRCDGSCVERIKEHWAEEAAKR